jgi:hypothetical protein
MKQGFEDTTELINEVNRQAAVKKDYVRNVSDLVMTRAGELMIVNPDDSSISMPMSRTAHIQLASNAKIPFSYYDRLLADDPDILATNVNRWFEKNNKDKLIRSLDSTVRAILSPRYRRIDNDLVVNTVLETIEDKFGSDLVVKSSALTENHLYIKVTSPKMEGEIRKGDIVNFGFTISNSETGMGMAKCVPFLERLICTNGAVIEDDSYSGYDIKKRHVGRNNIVDTDFMVVEDEYSITKASQISESIRCAVANSLDSMRFEAITDKLKNATHKTVELRDLPKVVELIGKRHGFDQKVCKDIENNILAEEDFTLYGIMNGVTAYAKSDDLSYEEATRFETIGWEVVNMPGWEWRSITSEAAERTAAFETV